jgi:hypothetical protein
MRTSQRGIFNRWTIGLACAAIAAAGAVALSPMLAGKSAAAQTDNSRTCSNATQCLQRINTGTGLGISGVSAGGSGIMGQTTAFDPAKTFTGITGLDLATPNPSGTPFNNAGVLGKTSTGIGVWAVADRGTALVANANGGSGVFGTTQSNVTGESSSGVFGEDVGNSSVAAGVTGFSGTGIAVQGDQFERGKFLNAAFLGLTFASSVTTYFPAKPPGGLFNSDIGEGVVAETSGAGAEALAAANFGGGPLFRAYAAKTEMLDLDNAGNMIIAGKLTQHGTPNSITHTARSGDVVMYSPMQAVATVEDVGEAQLSGGETYVRIDPRFADTMDRAGSYLVFLTPQGDTPGLYVTAKTASGFVVREHGGRSNVVFDYRIVAHPFEQQGARLADARAMPAKGFTRSMTTKKPTVLPNGSILIRH